MGYFDNKGRRRAIGGMGGPTGMAATGVYEGTTGGNKWADPADLFGYQAKKKQAEIEGRLGQNKSELDRMYGERPDYDVEWGKDVSAPKSILKGLNARMAAIKGLDEDSNFKVGPQYQQALQDTMSIRDEGFGDKTSPWAQRLYDQQALQYGMARDDLGRNVAGEQAMGMNRMAASGGLSGGGRERMAAMMGRSGIQQRQDLARQGQLDKMGIGIQEEQRKMQVRDRSPGMLMGLERYKTNLGQQERQAERDRLLSNQRLGMSKAGMWGNQAANEATQAADMARFNKMGAIGVSQGKSAHELGKWQTGMQTTAAGQSAAAIARAGGGGGGMFGGMFGG